MEGALGDMAEAPRIRPSCKKMCKGHLNKVNSVHFSGDSRWVKDGRDVGVGAWAGVEKGEKMWTYMIECELSKSGIKWVCFLLKSLCRFVL